MIENLKFIDLFAGIGGIRLGFEGAAEELGIETECVFTSEINQHSCKTYRKNFPNDSHDPENDITKTDEKSEIDDFNVLLAGFPCQAFSIAGKRGGFEDTRGTLFFDVARVIKEKKPDAFLLENVKGLRNHRSGKTLDTIMNVLKKDLGYVSTQMAILNSRDFGVPQNRERVYIVGFKNGGGGFSFPQPTDSTKTIKDILEEKAVSVKYYISDVYLAGLKRHRERHEKKGNGFGYEIKRYDEIANAVVVGGMGRERNLVIDKRLKDFTPVTHIKGKVNKNGVRRMTPVEWERLQGFPDHFTECVANVHRYRQLGNAVTVSAIKAISKNIIQELLQPKLFKKTVESQLEFSC
ncbi:MAG: DNA (cytosine-5-)-methyltransferase [PVC group bacterium]|nr:DNA (cytosine-5-)-methyltransferase [PVC group bacterium]